jgi:hypothetical protein
MHAPPKGILWTPNKVSKDCLLALCAGNVFSTVFEGENGRGHMCEFIALIILSVSFVHRS